MSVSAAYATIMLEALRGELDVAGGPPYWRIYGGGVPAPGGTPPGDLISQCNLTYPVGTVAGAVLTFAGPFLPAPILAAVNPTWARLHDGLGGYVMDVRARLDTVADDPANPAQVILAAPSMVVGHQIQIIAASVSLG